MNVPRHEGTPLVRHLAKKLLKKQLTSGSRLCKCGARISANKPACLACVLAFKAAEGDLLQHQAANE